MEMDGGGLANMLEKRAEAGSAKNAIQSNVYVTEKSQKFKCR